MYFIIFINDFSRKVLAYFMQHKSKTFAKFKLCKVEVQNQTGKKVKCLRIDNGTEYTNNEVRYFCELHGVKINFIVCKTLQQNGVAERMNRSIAERARCLRLNAGLANIF
jgi:transposase InsO family protein